MAKMIPAGFSATATADADQLAEAVIRYLRGRALYARG